MSEELASVELDRPSRVTFGTGTGILRALRVQQWLKNALVFLPMLAGHRFGDLEAWRNGLLCFVLFSLGASGQYVINDIADRGWDRLDLRKRSRPVASGQMSVIAAWWVAVFLVVASGVVAWFFSSGAFPVLVLYHACALAYTFALKRAAVLDVLMLAGLYGLRVFAGGAATGVAPSPWLIGFTLFLFLSLALLKRVTELPSDATSLGGRGFRPEDRTFLIVLGVNSGLISVVVLALYIQNPLVALMYRHPEALWLMALVLTYWISRTWLLAVRGSMARGLWISLATDPCGYAAFGLILVILHLAI